MPALWNEDVLGSFNERPIDRRIERRIEDARSLLCGDDRLVYDELRRWTYKPNWWLWIDRDMGAGYLDRLSLRAIARVPNSYDPQTEIEITGTHSVPEYLRMEVAKVIESGEFGHWLQSTVLAMERHESREWLKRDGKLYDDPHRTDR